MVSRARAMTIFDTYLLRLALPASLSFVGPPPGERGFSSLDHVRQGRVFFPVAIELGVDCSNNSPAAMTSVFEMLEQRVVAGLPAVQSLLAQETRHIVGVLRGRIEEEAGFCELRLHVRLRRQGGRQRRWKHTLAGAICL